MAPKNDLQVAQQNELIRAQKSAFEAKIRLKNHKTASETVVESWTSVMDIVEYERVIGEILFRRIFELNEDVLGLFSFGKKYAADDDDLYEDAEFVKHSTSVVETITAVVGILDSGDLTTFSSFLKSLGATHVKFLFTRARYDLVREALIGTLEMALDTDFTSKVKESWEEVFGAVREKMMLGGEKARARLIKQVAKQEQKRNSGDEGGKAAEKTMKMVEKKNQEKKAIKATERLKRADSSKTSEAESAAQDTNSTTTSISSEDKTIEPVVTEEAEGNGAEKQKGVFSWMFETSKKEEAAERSNMAASGETCVAEPAAQCTDAKTSPIPSEDKTAEPIVTEDFQNPAPGKKQSVITWILKKPKEDSKSGLTFSSKDNTVILKAVDGRASQKTNLTSGLEVLSVAGKDVVTATQAVKAFASAPVGPVKIVTVGSHHSAKKRTTDEKAGFAIREYHQDNKLIQIYKVNPNGMFPDLQAGQLLWSINGKRITSVSQGIKLMRNKKVLNLVVVDPSQGEAVRWVL